MMIKSVGIFLLSFFLELYVQYFPSFSFFEYSYYYFCT